MLITSENKIELLQKLDFLADQNVEVFQFLASIIDIEEVKKGTVIFTKGDLGGAVYIIAKGCIQIHDKDHVFVELEARASFGEYAIIHSELRSASAKVKQDSILIKCTEAHLKQLETKFDTKIIDSILIPLQNIKKRMVDKDLLEEELTSQKLMIERQRRELENLNATKDKFFSIIAHDLKNPFASLIGASNLLVDNGNELSKEQVKTFSSIINQSARQAFRLLENLLEWSRMQTGAIAWNPKEIDLWDLVNEAVNLLTGSAEVKDISLIANIREDLHVVADPNMINTVVRNLITNAIKFTPRGGEIILLSKQNNQMIEIWIQDNGIGISPEVQERLFRIDVQQVQKGTDNETGTGLGLILCKDFIERHHGKIWVESELGKGSTFIFSLPYRPDLD